MALIIYKLSQWFTLARYEPTYTILQQQEPLNSTLKMEETFMTDAEVAMRIFELLCYGGGCDVEFYCGMGDPVIESDKSIFSRDRIIHFLEALGYLSVVDLGVGMGNCRLRGGDVDRKKLWRFGLVCILWIVLVSTVFLLLWPSDGCFVMF